MNERAYARREAMRNNRSERNISRRRITQRDFINQSHGSILCSGVDAALLGDTLIPELVAGYPNDGRTTIMLTASPHRMQVIHELVSRGMPAIYLTIPTGTITRCTGSQLNPSAGRSTMPPQE